VFARPTIALSSAVAPSAPSLGSVLERSAVTLRAVVTFPERGLLDRCRVLTLRAEELAFGNGDGVADRSELAVALVDGRFDLRRLFPVVVVARLLRPLAVAALAVVLVVARRVRLLRIVVEYHRIVFHVRGR